MFGRMCIVLGLVLLGALCFTAMADAATYDANTKLEFSITEAALSAESVVSIDAASLDRLAPLAINEARQHQKADEQAKLTDKPDDNLLAGIFRRRNGEPRTPARSIFRGGGGLFRGACNRGGCG